MSRSLSPFRFRPQVWDLENRYAPAVLSDNLSATTADTEAAVGNTWLTSSFGTGASAHTLNNVTLLLSNPTAGVAEVDIYTDGGNQPGSLVAAVTSPSTYSTSSLAATTFTSASGVSLTANTTYWVVLKATSGEFDWAYTISNSGTGDGFQGTYGQSADAGATWFTYDIYPTQMTVTVDTGTSTGLPGAVAFSAAAYSATESSGTATITVTRTGGSTGAITVPVTVSGGTATSGTDYTGLPTTVTFADGATTATFTVTIIDDTTVEGSETATFSLGTPTGSATLGTQATATLTIADNDSTATTTVTPKLTAVATGSGSPKVIVYNADGTQAYTLTPFSSAFTGGVRVATADVTGDGYDDIIVGAGPTSAPTVIVYNGVTKAILVTFNAFESTFTGGVFVAAGDVDDDGRADVIVTPDQGGGPIVAIYSGATLATGGTTEMQRFYGIEDSSFRGGARAAVGDLNADGYDDVVVSAGFLGGPRISTYSGLALASSTRTHLIGDFFAFEQTLRNGAFVTVGDFNGDGYADIAFGGGPSGGPRVLVLNGKTLTTSGIDAALTSPMANFFAGDSSLRGGVRLGVGDANGDGIDDLLTGSGDGEESQVRVYSSSRITSGSTATADASFDPFSAVLANGVYVG
ncbi:choice-of-anchor R domain-containing protein [Limnoglobus roseus]|uniref:VCBS repeat-containing protein n=1 Tax=Limnoglobus roseus TaxID=2598579 RepID=A0A5C1AMC8_9BACT|nr:choice-of-anchor R domain-containing protein [Limnoglobus roseus]QEL20120.1 VCBS repeat-containing protein [Limnoglobus roseus]